MRQGPIIVVDGPDGVGKTVLAKAIADAGFRYVHTGPPEAPLLQSYLPLLSREGPTVVDRLHLSTYAYGHTFHGGHLMSEFEEWLFEGWLLARGAFVIACEVPWDIAQGNLKRGPDNADATEYEVSDRRAAVWGHFEEAYKRTELHVFHYDYTFQAETRPGEAAAKGYADLARDSYALSTPRFDADVIGNSSGGHILFVGDRPNGWATVYERSLKAHDPEAFRRRVGRMSQHGLVFNSPSGRYLFHALRTSGLTLNDYCIMNALQWDGTLLRDLVSGNRLWFESRQIVALGRDAAQELTVAGLPFRQALHPSYVRRFHYKRLPEYARMLDGQELVPEDWT